MLNDLLPVDFSSLPLDKLPDAARRATRSGNFAQAAAILATGYEMGGPPVYMEQAYTYAHYLIISRRMIRRGADAVSGVQSQAILNNFSALYSDALIDRLEGAFKGALEWDVLVDRLEREFKTALNMTNQEFFKEPSGAMLLAAELELANGAAPDEVIERLPISETIFTRAKFVAAQAFESVGDDAAARAVLDEILARSPREPNALDMLGTLLCNAGDADAAADSFDKSLRATFTPVPDVKIPRGEIHYRSTILNRFDVYAYSEGFFVIEKRPDMVGVTMLGRKIIQVLESPGYKIWMRLKTQLEKVVRIAALKRLLARGASDTGVRVVKGRWDWVLPFLYRKYDRFMTAVGAGSLRPVLKRAGFAVLDFLRPAEVLLKPLRATSGLFNRCAREPGAQFAKMIYRLTVLHWLQAREVPVAQQAQNADEIFQIVSGLLDEEDRMAPRGEL